MRYRLLNSTIIIVITTERLGEHHSGPSSFQGEPIIMLPFEQPPVPPDLPFLEWLNTHKEEPEIDRIMGRANGYAAAEVLPAVLAEIAEGRPVVPWAQVKRTLIGKRGFPKRDILALQGDIAYFVMQDRRWKQGVPMTDGIPICLPWTVIGIGRTHWRMVRLSDDESKRELDATIQRRADEAAKKAAEREAFLRLYLTAEALRLARNSESPYQEPKPTKMVGKVMVPGDWS